MSACTCSPLERIAGDNDPDHGTTATRLLNMLEGRCNACGGDRPDAGRHYASGRPVESVDTTILGD